MLLPLTLSLPEENIELVGDELEARFTGPVPGERGTVYRAKEVYSKSRPFVGCVDKREYKNSDEHCQTVERFIFIVGCARVVWDRNTS